MGSQRKRNMPMMCNDIKSKTFRRKHKLHCFSGAPIFQCYLNTKKKNTKNKVSNIFVTISSSTEKIKTHANSVLRFEILLKQSSEPKIKSFRFC